MKKYLISTLAVIAFISCKKDKSIPSDKFEKIKTEDSTLLKSNAVSQNSENDSDCVFSNDYKKLTAEWLAELGFKKYSWDSKNDRAILVYEGDTLTLYKGGCYHFVSSVEIKTKNPLQLSDSLLQKKISTLACKFKFDNYCKQLGEGRFEKKENGKSSLFLEFEDDDPEDNLIYEGIEVSEKSIKISEYYN